MGCHQTTHYSAAVLLGIIDLASLVGFKKDHSTFTRRVGVPTPDLAMVHMSRVGRGRIGLARSPVHELTAADECELFLSGTSTIQ